MIRAIAERFKIRNFIQKLIRERQSLYFLNILKHHTQKGILYVFTVDKIYQIDLLRKTVGQ